MAGRGGRKASPCWEDRRQLLCPALAGRSAPDAHAAPDIPTADLPHDDKGHLLRPGVVWFEEQLDPAVLDTAEAAAAACDLFISCGTSAVVYPAAGFAQLAAERGRALVAEFNLEPTPATGLCDFSVQGKAGDTLPVWLGVEEAVARLMQQTPG